MGTSLRQDRRRINRLRAVAEATRARARDDDRGPVAHGARGQSIPTAAESAAMGQAMEEAIERAHGVVASWPLAIARVLAAAERVRAGELPLGSVTVLPHELSQRCEVSRSTDAARGAGDADPGARAMERFLACAHALWALAFERIGADHAELLPAVRALRLTPRFLSDLHASAGAGEAAWVGPLGEALMAHRATRERLFSTHLGLVRSIASSYRCDGVPFRDLIQEANVALLEAVDAFDWRGTATFRAIAKWAIHDRLCTCMADTALFVRLPDCIRERGRRIGPRDRAAIHRAVMMPVSIDALRPEEHPCDASSRSPANALAARELRQAVEEMLTCLGPRSALVLRLRLGIGVDHDFTLQEVGDCLGITRARTQQMEAKQLRRLRAPYRSAKVRAWVEDDARRGGGPAVAARIVVATVPTSSQADMA